MRSKFGAESSGEEAVCVTFEAHQAQGPCWDTQEDGIQHVVGGKKLKSSEEERTKIEAKQAQARTLKNTHILEEGEELENV